MKTLSIDQLSTVSGGFLFGQRPFPEPTDGYKNVMTCKQAAKMFPGDRRRQAYECDLPRFLNMPSPDKAQPGDATRGPRS